MGTDTVHDGDDGERNASSDQSIFDRGSGGLVSAEFANQCDHAGTVRPDL